MQNILSVADNHDHSQDRDNSAAHAAAAEAATAAGHSCKYRQCQCAIRRQTPLHVGHTKQRRQRRLRTVVARKTESATDASLKEAAKRATRTKECDAWRITMPAPGPSVLRTVEPLQSSANWPSVLTWSTKWPDKDKAQLITIIQQIIQRERQLPLSHARCQTQHMCEHVGSELLYVAAANSCSSSSHKPANMLRIRATGDE
ncbi:PREDICTED: uncharacterized protein LOC108614176 isoform X1 [Drosophila arizonae]|uniref:Uncharacterized protein LOC108614176 isoform X1 n=1 Tax=Drosophila arizonae TaxID=7263 RepID=A0ABM1P8V1_DROAR|nr:PREDICTED: uncharacterized protein LOC108614176 isoform X1 [Drosophila arizonae]